jgi:Zn-dependent protease with chaperone function
VTGLFAERGERLMALASAIRVGPAQYPRLDRLRNDCAEILDLPGVPSMFVARSTEANAYTLGIDEPFIVLTTGLVEALDTESLRFSIGHEMGHVLSGHAVLRTVLLRMLDLRHTVSWVPAGVLGMRAMIAALSEWFRKAELTCDRAGLLCTQDPEPALRAHLYLAGGSDRSEIDISSFLEQAREYEEVVDIRDSIHKLMMVERMSHPLAVVRAAQLQRWAASEEYRAILGGDYPRRDDATRTLTDDLTSAARSYRDDIVTATDPVAKVFTEIGSAVSGAARNLRDRFGNPPDPD